jgi:hypothetical protein
MEECLKCKYTTEHSRNKKSSKTTTHSNHDSDYHNMAVNTRNSIVTNGLVLALDAGNTKSYTSGSVTWGNLANPPLSGSLINGPTFDRNDGGSIRFDGVDDYATVPSSNLWALGTNGTIAMWAFFTGNIDANHRLWCTLNSSTYLDAYIDNATGVFGLHGSSTSTTTLFPRERWVHVSVTYINGNIAVYFNGIPQPLQGQTTAYNITNTGTLFIGQYSGGGGYTWRGRMSSMLIYNRGFSAQEILQNYNATKTRFGLT